MQATKYPPWNRTVGLSLNWMSTTAANRVRPKASTIACHQGNPWDVPMIGRSSHGTDSISSARSSSRLLMLATGYHVSC